MAKSKTQPEEKPATPVVGNGNANGQKKKKKNDPLRPQPAWLYPTDEENPVLNGKTKSEKEVEKETEERLEAINFLTHRSVSAPVKDAPPGLLMQLIGSFLTSYGFNSTGRIFTIERDARKKISGWSDELGKKYDKGQPSLLQIFKRWEREWALEQAEVKPQEDDDQTSEEDESEASEAEVPNKKSQKSKKPSKGSDSSDSDSESDDDEDEEEKPAKPSKKAATPAKKRKAADSDSDSDSDSSSDDDSDAPVKKRKVEVDGKESKKVTSVTKVDGVKAKETVKTTPAKVEKTTTIKAPAKDSDDSSDDSDSDGDSSAEEVAKPNGVANTTNGTSAGSDSTSTLNGDAAKKDADADSDSDADSSSDSSDSSDDEPAVTPKKAESSAKRKRSKSPAAASTPVSTAKVAKKSNEPFSRIPKDQYVDPRLSSNKYVPYDYAQKAHEDLIVTKGKGFTKEKNKKKRGSYRGGAIDLGGGKGIKFED